VQHHEGMGTMISRILYTGDDVTPRPRERSTVTTTNVQVCQPPLATRAHLHLTAPTEAHAHGTHA
jgi:hypothetical protein